MKKISLIIVAAMAMCMAANSQEVMKVELKNGQVVSYPVESISHFYFESEQAQEQLAENCEMSIADEVVLNTSAALKLNLGSAVERIYFGQTTPNSLAPHSDDVICQLILQNGKTTPKSNPYVFVEGFEEGKEYVFIYFGVNAEGKRGPLYKYHFSTAVAANEPQAVVSKVEREASRYLLTINADKTKVKEYYIYAETSETIDYQPSALWGLYLKSNLNYLNVYEDNRTVMLARNNETEELVTLVWARGYDGELSGYIDQRIWVFGSGARMLSPTLKSSEPTIHFYSEEEAEKLVNKIRRVAVRH